MNGGRLYKVASFQKGAQAVMRVEFLNVLMVHFGIGDFVTRIFNTCTIIKNSNRRDYISHHLYPEALVISKYVFTSSISLSCKNVIGGVAEAVETNTKIFISVGAVSWIISHVLSMLIALRFYALNHIITHSGNGLLPNKRKAITWRTLTYKSVGQPVKFLLKCESFL